MKNMMKALLTLACLSAPLTASAYEWAAGTDGYLHCYPADGNGNVCAGESAVSEAYCSRFAKWGVGTDNQIYCYPVGDLGVLPGGLNASPDFHRCYVSYQIRQGNDGNNYCYPADSFGIVLAGLNAVDPGYCN